MGKICIICKLEKELDDFYKNKGAKDNCHSYCKLCFKKRSSDRAKILNRTDGKWKLDRRLRCRKYRELNKANIANNNKTNRCIVSRKYAQKNNEKIIAHRLSKNLPPPFDGAQRHHWSYRREHAKDIFWLSIKDHGSVHTYLLYDKDSMCYYRLDTGQLLDTKEKHEKLIKQVLTNSF